MREETWPLDALRPHPRNYNAHPAAQVERIADSLRAFGQPKRIVIRSDGTILAGHGVWQGARYAGYDRVQVAIVPDEWTDERATAYLVADNETRRGAELDETALAELVELARHEVDLSALGFDETALQALLDSLTPEMPEPGDGGDGFEPDEDMPCRVQTGDLWVIGGVHRLLCGDCTDAATVARLMGGERADAVVTDPPYGIKRDKGFGGFGGFGPPIARRQYSDEWDSDRPSHDTFTLILHLAPLVIIWGGNYFADLLPQGRHWIVWDKHNTMPTFGDCELAWTNAPRTSVKKYDITYNGLIGKEKERYHPTQKPVALFEVVMTDYTQENAIIIDTYIGSGTSIIAAHRTGRRCYGTEISPAYCEVILQRAEAEGLPVDLSERI